MRKLTKRERVIEICKNLTQTIDKMICHSSSIEHKNEVFEIPRANKSALIKLRQEKINKYKITQKEINDCVVRIKYL
jgi:hypothetical protein